MPVQVPTLANSNLLSFDLVCSLRERVRVLRRVSSPDTCPKPPDWRKWYPVTVSGVLRVAVARGLYLSQDSACIVCHISQEGLGVVCFLLQMFPVIRTRYCLPRAQPQSQAVGSVVPLYLTSSSTNLSAANTSPRLLGSWPACCNS